VLALLARAHAFHSRLTPRRRLPPRSPLFPYTTLFRSSDMAFRQAGRIAMADGLPKCSPVLLEPVMQVEIAVPNDATATVTGIVSDRKSTRLNSSHVKISYAVFCLKKKTRKGTLPERLD